MVPDFGEGIWFMVFIASTIRIVSPFLMDLPTSMKARHLALEQGMQCQPLERSRHPDDLRDLQKLRFLQAQVLELRLVQQPGQEPLGLPH